VRRPLSAWCPQEGRERRRGRPVPPPHQPASDGRRWTALSSDLRDPASPKRPSPMLLRTGVSRRMCAAVRGSRGRAHRPGGTPDATDARSGPSRAVGRRGSGGPALLGRKGTGARPSLCVGRTRRRTYPTTARSGWPVTALVECSCRTSRAGGSLDVPSDNAPFAAEPFSSLCRQGASTRRPSQQMLLQPSSDSISVENCPFCSPAAVWPRLFVRPPAEGPRVRVKALLTWDNGCSRRTH
jgi:hypothetical protein